MDKLYLLGAGLAILTGAGAGVGIGLATGKFMEAVSRQPEVQNKLTPYFFIGLALSETTAILAFVISIMILSK
jgi:F-type H+-transporting ATPase subunit c